MYSTEFAEAISGVDVDTGEVKVCRGAGGILRAPALGSCVAVFAYERSLRAGGLAHVMLPGKAAPGYAQKTRYAVDAIARLVALMQGQGCRREDLEFHLVGGANVLGEGDIPDQVIASVLDVMWEQDLCVCGKRLGGFERRSALMEAATGRILFSEGDGEYQLLSEDMKR